MIRMTKNCKIFTTLFFFCFVSVVIGLIVFFTTPITQNTFGDENTTIRGINHRGYNLIAPENTLSAFRLSKAYGFDYVETDVRFTSDGIPVLLHDPTIDRTSNGSGKIAEITYAQVSQYDFGSWKAPEYTGEKIPTFKEFIELCKNLNLKPYIEVYAHLTEVDNGAKTLVDIIKEYDMLDNVTWISFNGDALDEIAKYHSYGRFGILNSSANAFILTNYVLKRKTTHNSIFVNCKYDNLTDNKIRLLKAKNIPLEVYTTDEFTEKDFESLDPYISAVTHDTINAKDIITR